MVNINSFVELAKKYTSFEKLTPGMLHELVEKIIVHEGDKSSGHRIQKIEIYYSFGIFIGGVLIGCWCLHILMSEC